MKALLQLAQVSVFFGHRLAGVRALHQVSLVLVPGERVALVGANGCGKSTLLRVLHGLVPPSEGALLGSPALRQAMLFQRAHLLRLSVQANVALGLWLAGHSLKQARSLALQALQRLGLADLARRPARQLSGGQQQRVALARAWALSPQLLLLDEPTASLDPHAKRELEGMIAGLAAQSPEVALVFASHNLGQVKRLATRVIYLERGCVLADLPVADFFSGPLLAEKYPEALLFAKGELV